MIETKIDGKELAKRWRILDEISIDKIAAVDHPCQEGAVMTIIKRADPSIIKDRIADRGFDYGSRRTGGGGVESAGAARMYAADGAPSTLDEAVDMIRLRDKVGKGEALRQAGIEFPDLVTAYNGAGLEKVAKAREAETPIEKSAAAVAFEKRVNEVMAREQCSRFQALAKAALEYPREQQAFARS